MPQFVVTFFQLFLAAFPGLMTFLRSSVFSFRSIETLLRYVDLFVHSGRLDRMDEEINVAKQRLDRAEREDRAAQKRHEAWESRQEELEKRHNELRHELRVLFNRILDKLDERLQ